MANEIGTKRIAAKRLRVFLRELQNLVLTRGATALTHTNITWTSSPCSRSLNPPRFTTKRTSDGEFTSIGRELLSLFFGKGYLAVPSEQKSCRVVPSFFIDYETKNLSTNFNDSCTMFKFLFTCLRF